MEYILNNTILALLDYPGSTMLGVNRMMSDKNFRLRVYPKVKDPVVKSFWINEFDKWEDRFRKEAVAAIQNKVGQFLSSPVIRHIVGQPKSTIDMREIMDNGKILIVNLSKGRIGEDAMRLLGGMIVTKIQLAAMGRVEVPEEARKDFFLYVDEFQNFATESFANILSEARKYRLSLILAHQYINQLIFDGNATVRDAVFGNIGTLISFRVGAEDAEHLEKEFEPIFMINNIVNLSKYQIYLKLMIDGIAGNAFSATTLPPADISETADNADKVIKVSRERYGRSRGEIEEKIARWSGMFDFDSEEIRKVKKETNNNVTIRNNKSVTNSAPVAPTANPETIKKDCPKNNEIKKSEPVSNNAEPKIFETVCDTCGENIKVPFQPDPKRPTFCKECLKDYQRARALSENEKRRKENGNEKIVENKNYPAPSLRISDGEIKSNFVSEKTLNLSQLSRVAPKKFKFPKKKTEIDLSGVRDLINKTKINNG